MRFYLKKHLLWKEKTKFCIQFGFIYWTTLLHSVKAVSRGVKLQIPEKMAGERGQPGFLSCCSPAVLWHRERCCRRDIGPEGGCAVPGVGVRPNPCRETCVLFSMALVSSASWPLASGCAIAGHSLRYFKACFLLEGPRGFVKSRDKLGLAWFKLPPLLGEVTSQAEVTADL